MSIKLCAYTFFRNNKLWKCEWEKKKKNNKKREMLSTFIPRISSSRQYFSELLSPKPNIHIKKNGTFCHNRYACSGSLMWTITFSSSRFFTNILLRTKSLCSLFSLPHTVCCMISVSIQKSYITVNALCRNGCSMVINCATCFTRIHKT